MIFSILTFHFSFCTIINVPDEYSTIQSGIDASVDGDTVLVQPGTYIENINFDGHNITLGSMFIMTGDTSYITQTMIDGNENGSVVIFESGEDSTTVMEGIKIQNGEADWGGGIHISHSSPTMRYLYVFGNRAEGGGGISLTTSNSVIRNSLIAGNHSWFSGGGIAAQNSEIIIINSTISMNASGFFEDGEGGGLWGGLFILINSILGENSYNELDGNAEFYYSMINSVPNSIQGNYILGDGSSFADPHFIAPFDLDFHLNYDSPCIDAGDPDKDGDGVTWETDPDDQDPDGTRMDMGAFWFDQSDCNYSGDINGDGSIDVNDFVILLSLIMEFENPPTYEEICIGDADGDSMLSVNDLYFNSFWCEWFAPYVPGLPPAEISLSDEQGMMSDSLFNIQGYLTNTNILEGVQFDLVFPSNLVEFVDTVLVSDSISDYLLVTQNRFEDRIRVALWSFTGVQIPDNYYLLLFNIILQNPGFSGEFDISLERMFANGTCRQPFDVEGDISHLTILQAPLVNLWLNALDEENQTVEVWISNEVDMAGFQLTVSGLHLTSIVQGSISDCGWMISWNSSGVLLGFSMADCGPGYYLIATLHYDYTTDDEICVNAVNVSSGDGSSLDVDTGPCLPVEYCIISGDLNGDSILDVLDVVMTVDCILQTNDCSCADLNFDSTVDVLDIVLMVEIMQLFSEKKCIIFYFFLDRYSVIFSKNDIDFTVNSSGI